MKQEKLSILYFILKGRILKSGEAPILLRVTVGGDYDEARIQRSVLPSLWDRTKECCKEKSSNEILLFQTAGVLVEYYKQAKDMIDYDALCDKLHLAIDMCKENKPHYAENLINLSLKIKTKQNVNTDDLPSVKAEVIEKMANSRQDNIGALSSLKKAIVSYKNLNQPEKVQQLSRIYSEKRKDLGLSRVETEYPSTKKINNTLLTEKIKDSTPDIVLDSILNKRWLNTLDEITEYGKSTPRVLGDFPVPVGIYDNIGNLVPFYKTQEEIEDYYFWDSYDVHANINLYHLSDYMLKAHELNKICYPYLIK